MAQGSFVFVLKLAFFLFPQNSRLNWVKVDLLGWTKGSPSATYYSPEWQQQVMEEALLGWDDCLCDGWIHELSEPMSDWPSFVSRIRWDSFGVKTPQLPSVGLIREVTCTLLVLHHGSLKIGFLHLNCCRHLAQVALLLVTIPCFLWCVTVPGLIISGSVTPLHKSWQSELSPVIAKCPLAEQTAPGGNHWPRSSDDSLCLGWSGLGSRTSRSLSSCQVKGVNSQRIETYCRITLII